MRSGTGVTERAPRRRRPARPAGFTLIELITVLVVVGVLGVMAAPRFFERRSYDAAAFTDQSRSLMRYGQKIAIAQGRNVFVRLNGSSVALCYDAACTLRLTPPAGSNSGNSATLAACANLTTWACEGVPNGLTMPSSPTFFFDPTGQPFAGTDAAAAQVSTFAPVALSITGDGGTHTLSVTAVTGYVY